MESIHVWYMILGGWGCSYLLRITPFLCRGNSATFSGSWRSFMEVAAFAILGGIISSTTFGPIKLLIEDFSAFSSALSHLVILVLAGVWFVWRGALIEALLLGLALTAVAEIALGFTG